MARPKKGEAREWHGHPCCAGPACGDSEGPPLQSSSCRGCPVHTAAGKDRTGQASRKTHPGGGDPSARTPPNTPSQPHGTPSLPGLPGAPSLLPSTGPQRSVCDRIVLQCRGPQGTWEPRKQGEGFLPCTRLIRNPQPAVLREGRCHPPHHHGHPSQAAERGGGAAAGAENMGPRGGGPASGRSFPFLTIRSDFNYKLSRIRSSSLTLHEGP